MPHFSSINNKYLEVFKAAGIHVIDPRDDVKYIIDEINASEILLTEAMHGAIVADAYRVPWIPIKSYDSFNHFKWDDWSKSHKLDIEIHEIPRFFESDNSIKFLLKNIIFKNRLKKIKRLEPYLSNKAIHENHIKSIEEAIKLFRTNYENNVNINGIDV
jgi:succinoglycan biosynthesis protein ExoV